MPAPPPRRRPVHVFPQRSRAAPPWVAAGLGWWVGGAPRLSPGLRRLAWCRDWRLQAPVFPRQRHRLPRVCCLELCGLRGLQRGAGRPPAAAANSTFSRLVPPHLFRTLHPGPHTACVPAHPHKQALNITEPTTLSSNSSVDFAFYVLGCTVQIPQAFTFSTTPPPPGLSITDYEGGWAAAQAGTMPHARAATNPRARAVLAAAWHARACCALWRAAGARVRMHAPSPTRLSRCAADVAELLPSFATWVPSPDSVANTTSPGFAFYQVRHPAMQMIQPGLPSLAHHGPFLAVAWHRGIQRPSPDCHPAVRSPNPACLCGLAAWFHQEQACSTDFLAASMPPCSTGPWSSRPAGNPSPSLSGSSPR